MRFLEKLMLISSLIAVLFCIISNENFYYSNLYLWPLVFAIAIYFKIKFKYVSLGLNTIFIVSFFKFTIMPVIICYTDIYSNGTFSKGEFSYYNQAIFLEIYCFILLILTMIFFSKILNIAFFHSHKKVEIKLLGNGFIYLLLFIIAVILFITIAYPSKIISLFFIHTDNNGSRLEESLSLPAMIMRQFIVIGFNMIFIFFCYKSFKKYDKAAKWVYMILPIIFAVLNIGLIIGERRSLQVYTTLCCVVILLLLFKKHRKSILTTIGLTSFLVLIGMTIYKHLNAFIYGSYSEALKVAISSGKDATGWGPANTLQAYLYGPQSIATALKYESINNFGFNQLFFDIIRSFIGLSFFVKDKGILLSVKYNHFLFNDVSTDTGHIIPNSVYGYIFFGLILAPVMICIQGFLITVFEYLFLKNDFLEIKFVCLFIMFRLSVDIYSNLPQSINVASLTLVSYFIILFGVYLFDKLLPKKRRFTN